MVRDRFIEFTTLQELSITDIGRMYNSSRYVVDSVPLAVYAAQKINEFDYTTIITELIKLRGDTDTICYFFK